MVHASASQWREYRRRKSGDRIPGRGHLRRAFSWWMRAAAMSDGDSMVDAGYCYQYGIGVHKNIAAARRLYRRALLRVILQCGVGKRLCITLAFPMLMPESLSWRCHSWGARQRMRTTQKRKRYLSSFDRNCPLSLVGAGDSF